jgi:polysaccharide pyruvyl transferase CsaB
VRIAVSGYYGFGNAGDEAVLAGIVHAFGLDGYAKPSDFAVLSADPDGTASEHGVAGFRRMDWRSIRRVVGDSDALISGGGSLLQDVTSARSLLYYLWVMAVARRLGRPVLVYAQGIGPLRRPLSRWLVRRSVERAASVSVRDPASEALLHSVGVRRAVRVTADPAFALDPPVSEEAAGAAVRRGVGRDRNVVALAVRPWPGVDVGGLVRVLTETLGERGYAVALAPLHRGTDDSPFVALREATGGGYRAAMAACAHADVVVAMRLHALVFAALAGTPVVGLSYDPKVTAMMDMLGQRDRLMPVEAARAEAIADLVAGAVGDADSIRTGLLAAASRLREKARSEPAHACAEIGWARA